MIGSDQDGELDVFHSSYRKCYVFEGNSSRYSKLVYKYGNLKNCKLYNFAVADYDGEIKFNISSNNNGASSSVGNFNEKWRQEHESASNDIAMIQTIQVPCINLFNFCKEHGINFIDDYISDIQGMDLQVLKTLQPMIDQKKLGPLNVK